MPLMLEISPLAERSRSQPHLALLAWYDQHGRKTLPWRQNPTPYRVWLSEIMLQQTQVASVLPYYQRFLQRFPDINALAEAQQDEVLGLWAGLGYYSRARHLQQTAQIICKRYNGHFPHTLEQLTALPGIGRSTAGAILAIAFEQAAAILDGNVKRVLARYGGIAGYSSETTRRLWALSSELTPTARVGDYTQAIMDLGATVCTRRQPNCQHCPLHRDCIAYRQNRIAELPSQRPKKTLPTRDCYFLILRDALGRIYLEQKPAPGLWGGLWCFPEFAAWEDLQLSCQRRYGDALALELQPPGRHTFSHYQLRYTPVLALTQRTNEWLADGDFSRWADPHDELPPLATPIKQLFLQFQQPQPEMIS